jgi:hypothetical protein
MVENILPQQTTALEVQFPDFEHWEHSLRAFAAGLLTIIARSKAEIRFIVFLHYCM